MGGGILGRLFKRAAADELESAAPLAVRNFASHDTRQANNELLDHLINTQGGQPLQQRRVSSLKVGNNSTPVADFGDKDWQTVNDYVDMINNGEPIAPAMVSGNGFITDGSHRQQAYKQAGKEYMPVIYPDNEYFNNNPLQRAYRYLNTKR